MSEQDEELLEAGEAAKYLADKWGIPEYSTDAFKMLRRRWNLKPAHLAGNATLWRKSDLDKIPKPQKGRRKGEKGETEGGDTSPSSSVARIRFSRLETIGA